MSVFEMNVLWEPSPRSIPSLLGLGKVTQDAILNHSAIHHVVVNGVCIWLVISDESATVYPPGTVPDVDDRLSRPALELTKTMLLCSV